MIDKAIKFATEVHKGASRKNNNIPYIIHPLEVASIANSLGADEDTIVASLLHDTIEDANVTYEDIEKEFNKEVADLVMAETEDKMLDKPKSETWETRKKIKLNSLKKCTDARIKIIAFSDKLSNLRSLNRDFNRLGNKMWDNFNQKDPLMHKWYYESLAKIFKEFKNTYAYKEYKFLLKDTFKNL